MLIHQPWGWGGVLRDGLRRVLLDGEDMAIWRGIFARAFLHVLGVRTRGASAAAGSGAIFFAC